MDAEVLLLAPLYQRPFLILHIGIHIEMDIERSHLEACNLIDGMLNHVFYSSTKPELDYVKHQFLMMTWFSRMIRLYSISVMVFGC